MSDSSEEKWCYDTKISYDFARDNTLIPGTVEDKFTLDPPSSKGVKLQLKIGDIKNTVELAPSDVDALTYQHLTLGKSALKQLQFIILNDLCRHYDELVIYDEP